MRAWLCVALVCCSPAAAIRAPVAPSPAGPIADPPAVHVEAYFSGDRREYPQRPAVADVLQFDVDALPVVAWGDARAGTGFTLTEHTQSTPVGEQTRYHMATTGSVYTEVVVEQRTGEFAAFTGGPFGSGAPPPCRSDSRLPPLTTSWIGFSTFTDRRMDLEMGIGSFDPRTCAGSPSRSLSGMAAAIVPGFVYAVRTRERDEEESLVVVLPRGRMVSATGSPIAPFRTADTGAFTRLTFPLVASTAASASVRVSPASLRLWEQLRKGRSVTDFVDPSMAHEDLLVGLDIVCQGEQRTGALHVGAAPNVTEYERFVSAVRQSSSIGPSSSPLSTKNASP